MYLYFINNIEKSCQFLIKNINKICIPEGLDFSFCQDYNVKNCEENYG